MSQWKLYRTEANGRRIDGVALRAFINNGRYYLTDILVFQDGMIDCWDLVTFEEFMQKVRKGWVVTQPPEGAEIGVDPIGDLVATNVQFWVSPEDFIKEVADEIAELNGQPSTSELCRRAWAKYQEKPCHDTKLDLRSAYEAVPEHMRLNILRDFDAKDIPIRKAICGE